jgi:hypothetical protein
VSERISESDPRIYRYVVAYDGGTAPRPFDGLCSLAICKPRIRAAADVGDWIIGFRSRHPSEVLYAMQVTERLTLGDYWLDPRFSNRRPGQSAYPDNFYSPTNVDTLEQVPNHVHVPADAAKDCRGRNVLLSERFWYFGANSVPLPNELLHLVHTTQGHSVHHARRPDDVAKLRRWLETWPVGMHGQPVRSAMMTQETKAVDPKTKVEPVKSSCTSGAAPSKPSRARAINANVQEGAPPAPAQGVVRRIVLSRKGFDGSYGRMPSPILPDGKLLPLPIPARHDVFTMGDLQVGDVELPRLLHDLSRGEHSLSTHVHLDPDLDRRSDLRLPGWRPSLGQTGAAQSHLASQGVGIGDVFLFFGWFREVEQYRQRWRFVPRAQNLHVMFGWLEIDEVLSVVQERKQALARHPWIANHPHVANPAHYDNLRNTLYIAPISSRYRSGSMGGGLFSTLQPELQLTAPDGSRSQWNLPAWFHPGRRTPLSYHGDPGRWSHHPQGCNLRSVAKGQEFVLHATEYPESQQWLTNLVTAF